MRIDDLLQRRPKWLILALALILVLAIGGVDAMTGVEITFATFYLIPVTMAACVCPPASRYAVCLLGTATSLAADFVMHPQFSEPWIPYWNALMRFGTFVVAAELTATLANRNGILRQKVANRKDRKSVV